jgi:hypothetical protein
MIQGILKLDLILSSPGLAIGTTYYDLQSNGPTGNRIAVDQLGGIHFCWIGATDPTFSTRNIYYRFMAETGDLLPLIQIPGQNQSGFPVIAVLNGADNPDLEGAAVVGYHNSLSIDNRFATETSRGSGSFSVDSIGFPENPGQSLWPSFSIDINDNIHAIATQSDIADGQLHYHIYSKKEYGSSNWTSPLVIDTTYTPSPRITSSRLSTKTAIAWPAPVFQDSNEYDNDIRCLESLDGINWDIPGGRTNITNYPQSAPGDTVLRAYCDLDAIYDFDDNLHLVWNASYVTRDSLDKMVVLYQSALFHWSQQTGINLIYDHPTREWPCDMGAWNLAVSKMSLAVDSDSNFLYIVFTRFDPSDFADFDTVTADANPCGGDNAMPCANGELYLTWSTDNGTDWSIPVNVTDSPSPGCLSGDCDNDNWSSMAEVAGDYLNIIYIDDKDAGAAPYGEGDATQNPVLFLQIPNPTRDLGGCAYVPGDINGNGSANGIDVTFGVSFFKGGSLPPIDCNPPCAAQTDPFYAAGDVNGNCTFNGIDITFFVSYLKGGRPALLFCPNCPPIQ